MPKGAIDPPWPLIDAQQQTPCYAQFNVGRSNQISASKGVFQTPLKSTQRLPTTSNNVGTLNRNRPCSQMRHRPWSPQGVDQFGRQVPMVNR